MARFENKFSNNKPNGNRNGFKDNKRPPCTETVPLGTFLHPAGDLLVLKVQHKDIPYPNAPVLFNKKQIGKIDEVFGPVNDVYASVKLEPNQKMTEFTKQSKFEGYKDKFIFKDRFLPREEVEKKKEERDKKKGGDQRRKEGDQRSKGGFDNKKRGNFQGKKQYGNKPQFKKH